MRALNPFGTSVLLEISPFRFIVGPRIRTPSLPVYGTHRLAHKAPLRHSNQDKNRESSYEDIAACSAYMTF